MSKTPITLFLCCFVLGASLSIEAQDKALSTPVSATAESNNRVQDGLNGPVRRVRLETAQILIKEGKPVEGRRQLRGIATYDPRGRKIDTVAYPVEGDSLSGKEQYRYDEKGNIIEMVVRDVDGSVLSKETYTYEFDSLRNWNKMTTSVALYENGTVSYEPTEVSYRTIAYYYGAVEKLESAVRPDSIPTTNRTPTTSNIKFATGDSGVAEAIAPSKASAVPPVTDNQTKNVLQETPSTGGTDRQNKQIADGPTLSSVNAITPAVPNIVAAGNEKASVKPRTEEASVKPRTEEASVKPRTEEASVKPRAEEASAKPRTEEASVKPRTEEENRSAAVNPSERREKISERVISTASLGERKEIKTSKPDETSPTTALYQTGLKYLAAGSYDQAADTLNQVIKFNPNDAIVYAKLGLAYSGLRKHKEAIVGLNTAIRIKPEVVDAEAYYYLGYSYSELGYHKEAVAAFKKALYATRQEAIDTDQASTSVPTSQIYYGLGLAQYNWKRYQEAIKELREAVKLDPKLAEAYYALALAYLAHGDRWSAQKQQKTLVSVNPALARRLADEISTASVRDNIPCTGSTSFMCR